MVGIAMWLACATWTGLSSASWLAHELEVAQAPVEQQKEVQANWDTQRQADLASERDTLNKEQETARNGRTKDIRDNAAKMAAETRTRIAELENQNTFQAKTEIRADQVTIFRL